jgi:hypothetical protein
MKSSKMPFHRPLFEFQTETSKAMAPETLRLPIAANSLTAELFKNLGRYDIGFGEIIFATIIGLKGLG